MLMITAGPAPAAANHAPGNAVSPSPQEFEAGAVRPTRFLEPDVGVGGLWTPGIEEADVLSPGAMLLDMSSAPAIGLALGAAPDLELGALLGGVFSTAGGNINTAGLGLQAKYRLVATDTAGVALFAQAALTSGAVNAAGGTLGMPLSYYPASAFSVHAMPLLAFQGGGTAPGVNFGAKLRLAPLFWVLAGDELSLPASGLSQNVQAGLRYELWPLGTVDFTLVTAPSTGPAAGVRVGTLGLTGYLGGYTPH